MSKFHTKCLISWARKSTTEAESLTTKMWDSSRPSSRYTSTKMPLALVTCSQNQASTFNHKPLQLTNTSSTSLNCLWTQLLKLSVCMIMLRSPTRRLRHLICLSLFCQCSLKLVLEAVSLVKTLSHRLLTLFNPRLPKCYLFTRFKRDTLPVTRSQWTLCLSNRWSATIDCFRSWKKI